MNWMVWRPVGVKGSLVEIETQWTIKDLLDCHEAMDIEREMEEAAQAAARNAGE